MNDYNAVYSGNKEIFTYSAENAQAFLEMLKQENKYLIYGGDYQNSTIMQVADSLNYPILVKDLILDDEVSAKEIEAKLVEMENIAKSKGYVVVVAHPYPLTIKMLEAWLPRAEEKGVLVSPVSLLLGKRIK
jgi:uncharacterized protein